MSEINILNQINGHEDLRKLNTQERTQLCAEIRSFLIENVSKTGGHLAGNLGAVELSVAIETVFDTTSDRLVFDVGHQSYVHKMLTGRQADFRHLRQFGGISGFPKPAESPTDAFVAGHASNSVSIALGMARARTLQKQNYNVVALIGDGACTGGMAYEGMNDAAVSGEPLIIILNDNEMSISKNVGGMSRHLSKLRSSENYLHAKRVYRQLVKQIPGGNTFYKASSNLKNRLKRMLLQPTIFEKMGMTYLGPADGHDLPSLIELLNSAKELQEPVLVHVLTKKGHGYSFAENDPAKFHGIGKFDPKTGETLGEKTASFSDVFGATMLSLAEKDEKICAITAAMPAGTGLIPFQKQYRNRIFDVGIAEEHAVSMAGGLAKQGMTPVVALYSTFLQRGYDQLMQDVGLLNLHVVLGVDRAGLVGDDGPTHHGVFDVGFLRQVPGMTVLAPASFSELEAMLFWATQVCTGPVAVRYPRGSEGAYTQNAWNPAQTLVSHRSGKDLVLFGYGIHINELLEAAEVLSKEGIEACVLRPLCLTDISVEAVLEQLPENAPLVFVEEVCAGSGIAEALALELCQRRKNLKVAIRNLGKDFVPHGSIAELYHYCKMDAMSIASLAKEAMSHEN